MDKQIWVSANLRFDDDSDTLTATVFDGAPVAMWDDTEIRFAMDGGDLSRVGKGRVPVLLNHDRDAILGVATAAWQEGDTIKAAVRFRDTEQAQAIVRDLRAGTYPTGISAGVRIVDYSQDKQGNVAVSEWRLNEISLASVPAKEVGFQESREENQSMTVADSKTNPSPAQDLAGVKQILALGEAAGQVNLAAESINAGESVAEFQARLRSITVADKPHTAEREQAKADGRKFNMSALAFSLANPADTIGDYERGLVLEYAERSREIGMTAGGHRLPMSAVFGDAPAEMAFATQHASNIAQAIETSILPEWVRQFVARTPILARTRMLTGLTGDVAYPRLTASTTASWRDDSAIPTSIDSTPAADQVKLVPHQRAIQYSVSRQAMMQNAGYDAAIRADAMAVLAGQAEAALLVGSGSGNEPQGVTTLTGVNAVDMGSNAFSLAYANQMTAQLLADSVTLDGSWLTVLDATRFTAAMSVPVDSGSGRFLVEQIAGGIDGVTGRLFPDRPCVYSPHLTTPATAVGVLARWSDVVSGFWGDMEVIVDPYTTPSIVRTTLFGWVDFAVLNADSLVRLHTS